MTKYRGFIKGYTFKGDPTYGLFEEYFLEVIFNILPNNGECMRAIDAKFAEANKAITPFKIKI